MSSGYVRSTAESWFTDASVATPYYPTINREQSPDDEQWFTARFNMSYRETTTFCQGQTTEEGEIQVVFFGPPGEGYQNLIAALEADVKTIMAMRDPTMKFVLLEASAPIEFLEGSASQNYGLAVYLQYVFYD